MVRYDIISAYCIIRQTIWIRHENRWIIVQSWSTSPGHSDDMIKSLKYLKIKRISSSNEKVHELFLLNDDEPAIELPWWWIVEDDKI